MAHALYLKSCLPLVFLESFTSRWVWLSVKLSIANLLHLLTERALREYRPRPTTYVWIYFQKTVRMLSKYGCALLKHPHLSCAFIITSRLDIFHILKVADICEKPTTLHVCIYHVHMYKQHRLRPKWQHKHGSVLSKTLWTFWKERLWYISCVICVYWCLHRETSVWEKSICGDVTIAPVLPWNHCPWVLHNDCHPRFRSVPSFNRLFLGPNYTLSPSVMKIWVFW